MNAQFEKISLWSIDLIDKAVILSQSLVQASCTALLTEPKLLDEAWGLIAVSAWILDWIPSSWTQAKQILQTVIMNPVDT